MQNDHNVIKIFVSCHKEFFVPKNPLLIPIQLGSAFADRRFEEMLHDDDGDNISAKNKMYCELTAQYWAWKNTDADYYGFFHYRRYLCFSDRAKMRLHYNNRNQIEVSSINEFNSHRLGFDNSEEMARKISEFDAVVALEQDVKKLSTPRGFKKSAYDHWAAHDRDFLLKKDLDRMLEILEKENKKLGKMARKYLAGKKFLGFNVFVMKKELFNELCSIEFSVLAKLEKEIDLSNYSQQQTRVYGFMGEIIFSSYIYMLEKTKRAKIGHVPLIYFESAEKAPTYKPIDNAIPVLFMHQEKKDFLLAASLKSFSLHLETDKYYDVLIETDELSPIAKNAFNDFFSQTKNVSIRYINHRRLAGEIQEMYGNNSESDFSVYIPFILKEYQKIIVFSTNLIFNKSISLLWEGNKNTDSLLCAPKDCYMQGKIKDLSPNTAEEPLSKLLKNPLDYYNLDTMVFNLEKFRKMFNEENVSAFLKKVAALNLSERRFPHIVLNALCAGEIKEIS